MMTDDDTPVPADQTLEAHFVKAVSALLRRDVNLQIGGDQVTGPRISSAVKDSF